MPRYIAFLRAINVGGRRVKMDRLRAAFEDLGLANVATFIASGNVIFDAETADFQALTQQIEAHLHDQLGYEVDTFLRSPQDLAAIAAAQPFGNITLERGKASLFIAFLGQPLSADAFDRVLTHRTDADDFYTKGIELYWLRLGNQRDAAFSGKVLEKAIHAPATLRNINTVRRLAAKYPG